MDIPHELRDEFPQEISLIEPMIRTNYEFRRLAERYDEVNRNIYLIESGEEPTTDEVLARLPCREHSGPHAGNPGLRYPCGRVCAGG